MSQPYEHEQTLAEILEKIRALPPEARARVARLVEILSTSAAPSGIEVFEQMSEASFEQIWDNATDAAYDAL